MAMLEYIYHSTKSENYEKILTLREKDSKDEKAFHLSLIIGEDIIACGSLIETEKGVFEIYGLFVQAYDETKEEANLKEIKDALKEAGVNND